MLYTRIYTNAVPYNDRKSINYKYVQQNYSTLFSGC